MISNNGAQNGRSIPQQRRGRLSRWRAEFPYHWDADDQVSRRELIRFAVMASGALFAATAGVAALNYLKPQRTVSKQAITATANVQRGEAYYFHYPTDQDEAILLHLQNGGFVAYSGKCTHLSCAVYYDKASHKLLCPCHDGVFDPQTGDPLAGPPQRSLPKITVSQDGTMIYVVEEGPNA